MKTVRSVEGCRTEKYESFEQMMVSAFGNRWSKRTWWLMPLSFHRLDYGKETTARL